ncbi:MAG: rane-associated zinc metalloprotease [Deltaproteobacteria bacterium]|nr:rane-associated zinc metalloprotease [Deltaproteobacteria bacterium]
MLSSILVAIVVLGFLILFHELGHFLVAKRVGVGVLKFSIGFGPKLIGRRLGRTDYVISAIPLGGFVKMVGEDPDEQVDAEDQKIAFQQQALWKRMAIVGAGPGANIVFAFLAFSLVFAIYGARVPTDTAKVGGVIENMPAAAAGLRAGDLVTAVNGTPVSQWEKLSETIRASGGNPITLQVQREGRTLDIQLTPEAKPDRNMFGETLGTAYVIGIERGFDQEQVGPLIAVWMGAKQTAWWVETLLLSVAKMFQGRIPAKDIGGPILIVQAAGQQARLGLEYLLHFMAVISINLGVLNLLPIPVLDGGHFLFFALEAILRRPLDTRHREIAQQVGLVLLISLMAFAFYNDIVRVVHGWG